MAFIIPAITAAAAAYSAYKQGTQPHPGPMGGTSSGQPMQSYGGQSSADTTAQSLPTILQAFQKSQQPQQPPVTSGAPPPPTAPPPSNPGPPANQTQAAAPQNQQPNPWLGQQPVTPTIAQAMRTYIP